MPNPPQSRYTFFPLLLSPFIEKQRPDTCPGFWVQCQVVRDPGLGSHGPLGTIAGTGIEIEGRSPGHAGPV